MIGKWHLGYTPETMPNGQGFDYSFGHMGGCIDNYSHFFYWQGPNRHDLWRNGKEIFEDGKYFPQMMADEAGAFIKKNKDKPFFCYVPFTIPHAAMQAPEDRVAPWRKKFPEFEDVTGRYGGSVIKNPVAAFAAMAPLEADPEAAPALRARYAEAVAPLSSPPLRACLRADPDDAVRKIYAALTQAAERSARGDGAGRR